MISVVKLIKNLELIANMKIDTKFTNSRIGDPTCVVSDATYIKKTFKKLNYRNLDEILRDCVEMSLFNKK